MHMYISIHIYICICIYIHVYIFSTGQSSKPIFMVSTGVKTVFFSRVRQSSYSMYVVSMLHVHADMG